MMLHERAQRILREINDFKLIHFTIGELRAILRLTAPEPNEEDVVFLESRLPSISEDRIKLRRSDEYGDLN